MSQEERVRLAVMGCGWIAGNRLRQIARDDLVRVVALVDPSAEACENTRTWAGDAEVVTDPDRLDPDWVDGVMISTPSALHAAQAVALLERGLPVFVQKPLGVTAAETRHVLDVAAARDLPLECDLCYRHLRSAVALREQLDLATVGRPFYLEACFHNAYRPSALWSAEPALAGGGALMDLGIHLMDLTLWASDQCATVRNVDLRCGGRPLGDDEVEDFARVDLVLEDDAEARLVTSWDASTGRDARIEVTIYGDNGTLVLSNRNGSFFHFDLWRHFGTWSDALAADDDDRWQAGPLVRWLRRVRAGAGYVEPPGVRHTAALLDAAYATGRPAQFRRPGSKGPASVSVIKPVERERYR